MRTLLPFLFGLTACDPALYIDDLLDRPEGPEAVVTLTGSAEDWGYEGVDLDTFAVEAVDWDDDRDLIFHVGYTRGGTYAQLWTGGEVDVRFVPGPHRSVYDVDPADAVTRRSASMTLWATATWQEVDTHEGDGFVLDFDDGQSVVGWVRAFDVDASPDGWEADATLVLELLPLR